jgi:peptidoglycan/LPS O-acetylase OafA/YrhL
MSILTAIPIVAFLIRDITPVSATLLSLTGFQWLFGLPTPVGPAWTLFLEIHFYTLIAVAIRIFGPLSQTKLRTLLAAWLGLLLIAPSLHLDAFNFLIDSEFGVYFVFGAVLGTSNLGTWSNFRVGLPLFFIAGIAALVRFQARASAEMPVWFALVAAILTLGSMVFLVFLSSIKKNPRVSRFKSTLVKSISTLGLMTYPVYLFHEQVGMLLVSRLAPALGSGIAMAVSLIFLLGFCLVIVKIYEPWARKALRQFFGLPEARRDSRV